MSGTIPRAPARLPEDVTALAERDRDLKDSNKNAVAKTYHTLKDLISSKFKKDNNESCDGLNNVTAQQLVQQQSEEYRSPYSALPAHMRQNQTLNQNQNLNQSQPNIWMGRQIESPTMRQAIPGQIGQQRNYTPEPQRTVSQQQRAASQPQLNMNFERRSTLPFQSDPQQLQHQIINERRGSLANIDVTDSDDGGFISKQRRPQTMFHVSPQQLQQQQNQQSQSIHQHQLHLSQQQTTQATIVNGNNQRNSPQMFQNGNNQVIQQHNHELYVQYQQFQNQNQQQQQHQPQSHQQMQSQQSQQQQTNFQNASQQQHQQNTSQNNPGPNIQQRHDQHRKSHHKSDTKITSLSTHKLETKPQPPQRPDRPSSSNDILKPVPGSNASSDYDKSGNHSSNVDSGRGSAAYSSGRKGGLSQHPDTSPDNSDSVLRPSKDNDSDWVDIVDAELRNILEPKMQDLNLRPESTVSGSVSSMTPPIVEVTSNGRHHTKESVKQEYGTDSYNRPGKGPIGPSRAGWPGSSIQKQTSAPRIISSSSACKKHEQTLLKRHCK